MYIRRKFNTSAAATGSSNSVASNSVADSSPMGRFSRGKNKSTQSPKIPTGTHGALPSRSQDATRSSFSSVDDKSAAYDPRRTKSEEVLHSELQNLAGDEHANTGSPGGNGGVKRLLKGKKLIRVVKRVPVSKGGGTPNADSAPTGSTAGQSNDSTAVVAEGATDRTKVLRVKVKRKKKEELSSPGPTGGGGGGSSNDADSMAPVKRGMRGRRGVNRNKSDASVGTGVLSRAKSWFTFGGMKVNSNGKDSFGVSLDDDDDDDEDDYEDRLTQAADHDDYYDEATADIRTSAPDEATATVKEDAATATTYREPAAALSAPTTPTGKSSLLRPSSYTKQTSATNPTPEPKSPKSPRVPASPSASAAVASPKSPARRRSNSTNRRQPPAPTQEIICSKIPPKKQPLTGVALRRLQIQEQWLSAGCNYKPNEALKPINHEDDDDTAEDVSEISYDDPIMLVVGPNATPDGEIEFWSSVHQEHKDCYGGQHRRTAEASLNEGIAQLNARQTTSAIESFLEAVNLLQERYGEANLAVARGMHLLGSAFFLDGQLPLAVEITRKAFDVRKETLGVFHTDTVDTFSNLAMIYLKMSKLLEAARIFNEVLKIRKVIYDEYHPSVAFPARSLACVYAMRKDNERARKNYLHALKAFEVHGMLAEHMDTEAEMRRFGIHPPVEDDGDAGRLEI